MNIDGQRVVRVFPRRTSATPTDSDVRVNEPPGLWDRGAWDAAHVSVAFTWDLPRAERLAHRWRLVCDDVRIGGPACGDAGAEFVPGRYLRHGLTITSRGCPNRCAYCAVPGREGGLRELPIATGHDVLDDNLLACSDAHFDAVCSMLAAQPERIKFTGGIEARRLTADHAAAIQALHPRALYFSADGPGGIDALAQAADHLWAAGVSFRSHHLGAYVLVGFDPDRPYRVLPATLENQAAAEYRCLAAHSLGFPPRPMVYRPSTRGPLSTELQRRTVEWRRWSRTQWGWSPTSDRGHIAESEQYSAQSGMPLGGEG